MKKVYLDFNASTPIAPEVAEAMRLSAVRLLRSARGARVDVTEACWPLLLGCVGGGRPTRAMNRRFDAAVDFTSAGNCILPSAGGVRHLVQLRSPCWWVVLTRKMPSWQPINLGWSHSVSTALPSLRCQWESSA
jgi:hypothetical protein